MYVGLPSHRLPLFWQSAMAYPTPTFQRSDSQSGFYTQTQQQRSSTGTGQQGQQNQSSRPRFESRSSSSSTANQSRLSEYYGDGADDNSLSDEIYNSRESINRIKQKIQSIRNNNDFDIEGLIDLFDQIKVAQKQGDLSCIRQYEPALLAGLSDPLSQLLKKIDGQLAADSTFVASFNAEDIHTVFNGFSVIIGESVSDSLLLKPHFNKVRDSLRHITECLMEHAIEEGFLQKHWDSSSLLNVLNWLSRGLKQGLLSAKNSSIKGSFTQALMLMKDWSPSAGETVTATTLAAPLDTRQLGKCMVQVGTALKFDLVTENAADNLIRDVVIGLCGGNALAQCTQWRNGTDSNQRARVLTPVLPEGAEVTNISNTVKDCLRAGILQLDDGQVQSINNSLCRHMNVISERSFLERRGQRLGNCANFLRDIFELEHVAKKPVLQNRTEYEKACKRMLEQITKISPVVSLDSQSIANLISFVKSMDRARRQPTELLRSAAALLMTHLRAMTEAMRSIENIAATLGGLHHLSVRGLTPPGPAVDQMISLINGIVLNDLATWPAKSRVALMQATVHCWQDLEAGRTPQPQHHLLAVMQEMLALPGTISEKNAYLMAAAVLIKQDANWLASQQLVLGRLLPAKAGALISEDDVLRELAQLKTSEPVIEKLPEAETVNNTTTKTNTTTTTTAITTTTSTTAQTGAVKTSPPRLPVGMTRVIVPENKPADTTNTATAKKTNTATTKTAATNTATTTRTSTATYAAERTNLTPVVPPKIEATVTSPLEYRIPKRVAKAKQGQISPLPSTDPVLKVRDTSSSVRASAHNNKPLPEQKANNVKTPSPPSKNQMKSAPKEVLVSKSVKQTPEQEWFQLLKQEGALSSLQLKRLKELLEKTPSLAISAEGKGNKARTALFFALSTGKAEAVSLIMRANAQTKRDIASTLRQVLDEVLIVGDSEASALKACLSMLSVSELVVLRDALNQQYKPGEMQKKVAGKLWEVLSEKGLTQEANVAIDNQLELRGTATTTKKIPRAEPVTSKNPAADPFGGVDDHGHNALMHAAADGNTDSVDRIIRDKSGAQQIKAVNNDGINALMIAAENGHTEVVKYLIDHTSGTQQVKMVSTNGWNALQIAAAKGHAEVIKLLIAHTSATEQAKMVDKDGWNALRIAAQSGHTEVVKLLIDHPSGTEQAKMVDKDGLNALMAAAANNRTEVVKLLIGHPSGAQQAKMVDKVGANALMSAAHNGYPEVVKLLIAHPSGAEQVKMVNEDDINALMIAAELGHPEVVKLLIAHPSGAEQVKMVNKSSLNALAIAAYCGHTEVVKLLIDHPSATEQAKMVNKDGINALMIAAELGHPEVVKLLIAHTSGAEQVKMVNKDGINALMIAALFGHTEVVKLLIAHTSGTLQAKMVNMDCRNALMIAVAKGQTEVVKLLIAHTSWREQAEMVDNDDFNALMIAIETGHTEIIKLLQGRL